MRNLYILPTTKPSKLFENLLGKLVITREYHPNTGVIQNRDVYITSDEAIKGGDYFLHPFNTVHRAGRALDDPDFKRIILSSDQELMKYGVQAIDEEFLEWIVKNPSCEAVVARVHEISYAIPKTIYEIVLTKEDLGYNSKLAGVKVPDKMVRAFIVPKELFGSRQFVGNSSKYKTEDYDELGRS
jgi:hypothetical protein